MWNAKLNKSQDGIKITGENMNNFRYVYDTTLMAEWTSLVAQRVKCLPTMRDTQVQSLGWEDLLEKETATDSSILAWKTPWLEEPGRLQSRGSQRVRHDWATSINGRKQRRTNEPLMKVKEETEKVGLNLNIQKTKIMASGPTSSRHIYGEKMQTVRDLFSWAPKSVLMVTVAMKLKDACSVKEML